MLRLSLICVFLIASTLATPISYKNNGANPQLPFQEKKFNIGAGASNGASREDDDDFAGTILSYTKSAVSPNPDAATRGDPLNRALSESLNIYSSVNFDDYNPSSKNIFKDGRFSPPPP